MTPEEYCVSESIKLARSLPLSDAAKYLRGLVLLAGDCEVIAPAREACMTLIAVDAQLELIAAPQGEFSFLRDGHGKGKDGHQ